MDVTSLTGVQDLIIAPLYLLIIMAFAINKKNSMKDKVLGSYFVKGLSLKLFGAFGVFIIYFFYFGGGDTLYYFRRATFVDAILFENFFVGIKLLIANPSVYDVETYNYFRAFRAFDMSSFMVVRMAAVTNLICFNSYLANAFLFSTLSYIGIWRLFKVLNTNFPNKTKIIAWSLLFIPSVFFWGSGVLKDNVTFGFLGLLISSIYLLLVKKQGVFKNLFFILISIYVIGTIKSYILLALVPSLFAWMFFQFKNKINSTALRAVIAPILLVILVGGGFGALRLMGNSFSKFSIDNAQERAEDMQRWHTYRVEVLKGGDGSSYNLGHVSFTPIGILTKMPAAINAAIFRPYLWEAGNPVVFLAALESSFFILVTLRLLFLFARNPSKGFSYLGDHPLIYFMLVFSLIFAFSVGFTSYNFGASSRYRIPLLPFYLLAVLLITDALKDYKKAP